MMDRLTALRDRLPALPHPDSAVGRTVMSLGGLLLIVAVLYYPVGMIVAHKIDDDTAFRATARGNGSHAVANAVALIEREVNENGWVANNPWFFASAPLDNMPNFQQGIIDAMARFSLEMSDQIGRVRGSSQIDPDLEKASGQLRIPGDRWIFDLQTSIAPVASSEAEYRSAARALAKYNDRLADDNAVFERRADNLHGTLERFAADIGSESAKLDRAISELSTFALTSDDVFYRTKGKLYGYYILLSALRDDYDNIISEKELANVWADMLASLKAASEMSPSLIINANPDNVILPSHLTGLGFHLLRARTKIKEITNILLK